MGFAWGAVFEDVNLDGHLDLMVSQNYVKWPVHRWFKFPGKLLLGAAGRSRASSRPTSRREPRLQQLARDRGSRRRRAGPTSSG